MEGIRVLPEGCNLISIATRSEIITVFPGTPGVASEHSTALATPVGQRVCQLVAGTQGFQVGSCSLTHFSAAASAVMPWLVM